LKKPTTLLAILDTQPPTLPGSVENQCTTLPTRLATHLATWTATCAMRRPNVRPQWPNSRPQFLIQPQASLMSLPNSPQNEAQRIRTTPRTMETMIFQTPPNTSLTPFQR